MTTLLIATRNAHKVGEIRAILGEQFQYLTLKDYSGAPAVVEDADTFAGNATKKAKELADWLARTRKMELGTRNAFVLADDSGLEVDALDGKPGVHSARFAALDGGAAGNSADEDNNSKLLRLLAGVPLERRTARFRCVVALTAVSSGGIESASPVGHGAEFEMQTALFEGTCEGRIDFAPRGEEGFGYDPLFVPNGLNLSFAQLGEAEKNRLSHRAGALAKLRIVLEH